MASIIRAAAIIVQNSQILLMHRIKNGEEYFVIPGGKVKKNESVKNALVREIKEETSLGLTRSKFRFCQEFIGKINHFFLCQVEAGLPILSGPEKERLCLDNWYQPEWVPVNKINALKLKPEELKKIINDKFLP